MQLHFFFFFFFFFFSVCMCSLAMASALSHHPAVTVAAAAPAPAAPTTPADAPKPDVIALMSKKGCKTFADLLTAGTGEVAKTFTEAIDGGLTVFCPSDVAMRSFMPKYKNLTAEAKISLLLYHGVPVYYSLTSLKSSNGVMNTLATDGVAKNYNFTVQNSGELVTVKSGGNIANIKSTVVDKDPLAVYVVDEVLEPVELFKPVEAPAPAPAPEVAADAPTAVKGKGKKKKGKAAAAPAGPEAQPSNAKAADESAGIRVGCRWFGVVVGSAVGILMV